MKFEIYSIFAIAILLVNCNNKSKKQPMNQTQSSNVFLQEWTGPYDGVPAFDKIDIAQLEEAILIGIEENLKEIETIAEQDEAPTFENTILPMERAGKTLDKVFPFYGILSANISTSEFRDIQKALSPKLSEFSSKITQNEKLFERIKSVYQASQKKPLNKEQQRVIELIYKQFEMNGANLDNEKKKRYAEINKELAELYLQFSNNVLHDEESYFTYFTKEQSAGLSDNYLKSAAEVAKNNGKEGQFAVSNSRSSMSPFLTYAQNRELREKVWTSYYSRGDNNDEFDNKKLIEQVLKLRKERVSLLGYSNYAEWRLQDRMAKNPANALNLMEAVWPAAIARVAEEVADMQEIADSEGSKITIEPWDYRYYAEKVRQKKYDLNSDEVKQYLQLDNLREAMFYVAGELFNFSFYPIQNIPVFQEDVKVWEVKNKNTDEIIGLWYLDPFARKGKRSGAWATTYRSHTLIDGKKAVLASNNSNFVKPAGNEPVLVSWDDAETFFHEFGHALHFFSSNVTYPTLNGGVRDYTEFQSQLLERWLLTDPVINNYLKHAKTGKPMPKELVKKIKKSATFNQGFATTEYLASALIDMKIHLADPTNIDVAAFEKQTLDQLKMPKELPMRHRTPHFSHVFSSEGYATAYYGYMWADVLTSDASEAFAQSPDGYYDKELSKKLVDYLFAPRNAIDPAEAYRLFRGRDAQIEALMRDRGFPVVKN